MNEEEIALADKILPLFMSKEDYETFCNMVKELEKKINERHKK